MQRLNSICGILSVRLNRMKYFVLITFITLVGCASEEVKDPWQTFVPKSCFPISNLEKVEKENIFEVSHSGFSATEYVLKDNDMVPLREDVLWTYISTAPESNGELKPYLVRALYGHSANGYFDFRWCGNDLMISHISLGRTSMVNRTAFIVFLPKQPNSAILYVNIAE